MCVPRARRASRMATPDGFLCAPAVGVERSFLFHRLSIPRARSRRARRHRGGAPPPGMQHDYGLAINLTLLFYRAQRSGDLSSTSNPLPWRQEPSFLTDGQDVGVDLSKGYFDAGDYVKYGQPAAYSMAMLAWSGQVFGATLDQVGALSELKSAVRWGCDQMLRAAPGREALRCGTDWARRSGHCHRRVLQVRPWLLGPPRRLLYHLRARTSDAQRGQCDAAGTRSGLRRAQRAAAACCSRRRTHRTRRVSRRLSHALRLRRLAAINPDNLFLQDAGLPEVAPQYASYGFSEARLGGGMAVRRDRRRRVRRRLPARHAARREPLVLRGLRRLLGRRQRAREAEDAQRCAGGHAQSVRK